MNKSKMISNIRKSKGITLIALVITIIVLLILAGVTINAIIGNESVMEKAKKAKEEHEIATAKDEAVLLATKYIQEYYDKRYVQNLPVATSELPEKNLEVGKDGNSTYKISGIELIKSLAGETVPSTIGEYVANQFNTRATSEGTYKYEAGTYEAGTGSTLTVKNKQTDETIITGTIKEDGAIEWDASPSEGAATLTIGGEEITLTAKNAKDYYGTTVKIVDGVEYGLFYIDFAGKYGEKGTVYLRAKSIIGSRRLNGTLSKADKSTAIGIMKQINPDWANNRGNIEYSNYYNSEKGATYLCNPNNSMWSGIGNSFDSSELNYVIGAPSIEMFLDSYNAKYPNLSTKYTTAYRTDYNYPGYLYSNNGGNNYNYLSHALQGGDSKEMYRNTNDAEWLASPVSYDNDDRVCIVTDDDYVFCLGWEFDLDVAPLVSLKSGVHLVAIESKITVDGVDIYLGQLNATTVAQYYGKTVKEINGVEYGLFYVDYAGKYGAAGTVYLRAKSSIGGTALNEYTLPSEGSGSSSSSSSSSEESSSSDPGIDPPENAIEIMKQINPDWASNRGNSLSASDYLASERGAAYLCDKDNWRWSGIRDSFDSNYLNYVIGAPSVEMFLDSYNAKYPESSPKYTTAYRTDYEYPGYLYSNDNGRNYSQYYSGAIEEGDSTVGGMYRNINTYEWLASPLSDNGDNFVCDVNDDGYLDGSNWSNGYGVAPLVSLKSGVDLTNN